MPVYYVNVTSCIQHRASGEKLFRNIYTDSVCCSSSGRFTEAHSRVAPAEPYYGRKIGEFPSGLHNVTVTTYIPQTKSAFVFNYYYNRIDFSSSGHCLRRGRDNALHQGILLRWHGPGRVLLDGRNEAAVSRGIHCPVPGGL